MADSSASSLRPFKRVVLKLSGEAVRAEGSHDNISPEIVEEICQQIAVATREELKWRLRLAGAIFAEVNRMDWNTIRR